MDSKCKRILVCGHHSFAASGLVDLLIQSGYDVVCFTRGPISMSGSEIRGSVNNIHENPHINSDFDCVINYILLKDKSIEDNNEYLCSLLKLCKDRNVQHLIHISSISSIQAVSGVINELTQTEQNPMVKGAYGSLKVASDLYILRNRPENTHVSFVRPGFVLGKGLSDPIVGTGSRLPWNNLILIGNANCCLPVISRDILNQSIANLVASAPALDTEFLLLADSHSPTKLEYLEFCCTNLGCGQTVRTFPSASWATGAVIGGAITHIIGQSKLGVYNKLMAASKRQTFNSSFTEKRLGLSFKTDWKQLICESVDGQHQNYNLPYKPSTITPLNIGSVTIIGYGRIVKQRHLPALQKTQFTGKISAYDISSYTAEDGQIIQDVSAGLNEHLDLCIIATPGTAHAKAIELDIEPDVPIIVEKPLCYTLEELNAWLKYAESRTGNLCVCHNYRMKKNVYEMLEHLSRYNPGQLNHVHVDFSSPPVNNESAAWLRNERMARTLLMDYSVHFLDLACMFSTGSWKVDTERHMIDSHGHTSLIQGQISSSEYSVTFMLKQGFAPRKARVVYTFQNYEISIGFFPDTFVPHMSDDGFGIYKLESTASWNALRKKIIDKLSGQDSDDSHAQVYSSICSRNSVQFEHLTIKSVENFYRMIFDLAAKVYE